MSSLSETAFLKKNLLFLLNQPSVVSSFSARVDLYKPLFLSMLGF